MPFVDQTFQAAQSISNQLLAREKLGIARQSLVLDRERLKLQARGQDIDLLQLSEAAKTREATVANQKTTNRINAVKGLGREAQTKVANDLGAGLPPLDGEAALTKAGELFEAGDFEQGRSVIENTASRLDDKNAEALRGRGQLMAMKRALLDDEENPHVWKAFRLGNTIAESQRGQKVDGQSTKQVVIPDALDKEYKKKVAQANALDAMPIKEALELGTYWLKRDNGMILKDSEEDKRRMADEVLRVNELETAGKMTEDDEKRRSLYEQLLGTRKPDEADDEVGSAKLDKLKAETERLRKQGLKIVAEIDEIGASMDLMEKQGELVEARKDATEAGTQRANELFAGVKAENEERLKLLEEKRKAIEIDNTYSPAEKQAKLFEVKKRIEVHDSLMQTHQAAIKVNEAKLALENAKFIEDVHEQKIAEMQFTKALEQRQTEWATKRGVYEARRADLLAHANKLGNDLTEVEGGLKTIDQKRLLAIDKEKAKIRLSTWVRDQEAQGTLDFSDKKAVARGLKAADLPFNSGDVEAELTQGKSKTMEINLNRPTTATLTATQGVQDEAKFAKSFLGRLRQESKSKNVGGVGKVREFVQGLLQQGKAVFDEFRPERRRALQTIDEVGGDIDESIFYDTSLTRYQQYARLSAFFMAAAIAKQSGKSLSNEDRQAFERALGFTDTFTGKQQVLDNIQAAEDLLDDRLAVVDERLGGSSRKSLQDKPVGEMTDEELEAFIRGEN